MSAIAHLKNRGGRVSKKYEADGRVNHSYNTRMNGYTNGIPKGPRCVKPKKMKAKYANVQSKYSSIFSKYLHEPNYPTSIKVKKNKNGSQNRLIKRIFGTENCLRSTLANKYKYSDPKMNNANSLNIQPVKKVNGGITYAGHGQVPNKQTSKTLSSPKNGNYNNDKPYQDNYQQDQVPDIEMAEIPKGKDFDQRIEKAMQDLSEHKINFYKDKSEFDKQADQTKKDKEARVRSTFYGKGPYPGSHNVMNESGMPDPSSINSLNYYMPIGYNTSTRFRPSTQETSNRASSQNKGLADGDILSNIDNISNEELKERLVVSEMIMKKLFTRNKDLETALDKAQNKLREAATQDS
jgi:hypothetical protein